MLSDDLELITGSLIDGSVTVPIFNMIKSGTGIEQFRSDLCKEGCNVSIPVEKADKDDTPDSGLDILQWIATRGQVVTVSRTPR